MRIFSFKKTADFEAANAKLIDGYKDMFFCSYPMPTVIEHRLFPKLALFARDSMAFELSALAMMFVKDFEKSFILQGEAEDENGSYRRHAFVEAWYKGEPYILDLIWNIPILIQASEYFKAVKFAKCYELDGEEFWSLPESCEIYNAAKNRGTSFYLAELSKFRPKDGDYGYSDVNWMTYINTKSFGRQFITIMPELKPVKKFNIDTMMIMS